MVPLIVSIPPFETVVTPRCRVSVDPIPVPEILKVKGVGVFDAL